MGVGLGMKNVRYSLAAALLPVVLSVIGMAQQTTTFKVKHSTVEKAPKKEPIVLGKTKGPETASAANSKDLQTIEREKVTASSSRSAVNKTPALKSVKDKPNPPINFTGTGGTKSAGLNRQNANPYAGRLKQKYSHQ
jgi:hypothetical protein